jgi:hypothetical protein
VVTNYKSDLTIVYSDLSQPIEKLNKVPLSDFTKQQFKSSVISALVKCYQFNLEINKKDGNQYSFYLTSFLRGICEDLISLKFLLRIQPEKREYILVEYMLYLMTSSVKAQNQFFEDQRPFQPTVHVPNIGEIVSTHTETLNSLWQGLGHRKGKTFPSVEQMAIDSKLKLLYDFVYHGTSRAVHFSPNVLLRTGWYSTSVENPIIEFSVNNFSDYYSLFNSHYGTTLFIEFIKSFKKYLGLEKSFSSACKKLLDIQDKLYFFPEIITYEELNLERPSDINYKILEMASKMDTEERKKFFELLPDILAEIKKRTESE